MSSNKNNITLSNYEEYFILYMDNELNTDEKQAVDNFISLHPHLAEELELLMSTRLPLDNSFCFNKEELLSPSMKANVIDEALLLYVDDELNDEQNVSVEEKISNNKDYALQYALLMKTKAEPSEIISYPDKKDLYRHTEKVRSFPLWMRVAAAIIILLFGSLFFLLNSNRKVVTDPQLAIHEVKEPEKRNSISEKQRPILVQPNNVQLVAKATQGKKQDIVVKKELMQNNYTPATKDEVVAVTNNLTERKNEAIKFDALHLTTTPAVTDIALNKTITHNPVTSSDAPAYIITDTPTEPDPSDGDFKPGKKLRAKGFLRKVSRFIERNTGIGTVNADNELLVGAVALKLK